MEMKISDKQEQILALLENRTYPPPIIPISNLDRKFYFVTSKLSGTFFSTFDNSQAQEAFKIIQILLDAPDFDDFMRLAKDVRGIGNDGLFLYVLYMTVLHRDDCRGIIMPPIEECAPQWFFAAETIHEAIQQSIHHPEEEHVLENRKTKISSDPESRLAYFREDIGINSHHWAWHVTYPFTWKETEGGMKDRKGELFYYMHEQMLARYFCERLSNGLNRVIPLVNFREPLEGYSPHLIAEEIGEHFGSRPDGLVIQNFDDYTVEDLELWRGRIYDAIHRKSVQADNGDQFRLDNEEAIDIVGAIVEASASSKDYTFYGNLHNSGHVIISGMHDPGSQRSEHLGVMGFSQTAVRDPMFFRWHKAVDDIFYSHKSLLKPYTKDELLFEGISVVSAEVSDLSAGEKNVFKTFMAKHQTDLSYAPFLKKDSKISVEYERLDHEPFLYTININNDTGTSQSVTIRIFIGPKNDEFGNKLDDLNEQRRYMIELDKIINKQLEPGSNKIIQHSSASSVTVPRPKSSFATLKSKPYDPTVDYCICGWPDNLLIPRGTYEGTDFVFFVMCTNYAGDKPDTPSHDESQPKADVSSNEASNEAQSTPSTICNGAISYCGSKNQKYPDTKPMGYPFDRHVDSKSDENEIKGKKPALEEFITANMCITDVKIRFLGKKPENVSAHE